MDEGPEISQEGSENTGEAFENNREPFEPAQSRKRPARKTIAVVLVVALLLIGSGFAAAWNLRYAGTPGTSATGSIGTVALTQSTVAPPSSSLAATVKRVLPSVVNIHSVAFSPGLFGQPQTGRSEASGIIISRNGVILTNNHVVANSTHVTVSFTDGKHKPMTGTVLGTDSQHDLALVKVAATDLTPITVGSSSKLKLGDSVAAIGFPLDLGGPTVTQGIVSGLDRNVTVGDAGITEHLKSLIQTDAAINPGNSGGPLIDANGNLIGIDTAAASAGSAENTGFAISIDQAMPIIKKILQEKPTQQAWLGVEVSTLTPPLASQLGLPPGSSGVAVVGIVSGGPAASSGLRRGDVIQAVDGSSVSAALQLTQALSSHSPGEKVTLRILRPAGTSTVDVTLGQRPVGLSG
ncbi:MAG: putative serine protease PepD [Actinomycetota bacterium]|nr:putative serine protease PepD [Actinomycetota bacterium]